MGQEHTSAAVTITSPQRESVSLRAWEAVGPERELNSILAAVADVLLPFVSFDGIGIVVFAREARRRLYALHVVGRPAVSQETGDDCLAGGFGHAATEPILPRPQVSYGSMRERISSGEPYACADLAAKESWYRHEFRLAAAKIRSYVSLPLTVDGKRVGVAVFGRRQPVGFSDDQIELFKQVSRAFGVALSSALAYDEIQRLREQLALENIALEEQVGKAPWSEDIIGTSQALRSVLEAAEQVAGTEATVLITGETGTGKEMIARAIHRRSRRAAGPLISINCAAFPETLLASELFGHERGAFTGAHDRRKGRFELAQSGTLFLDEIGELSPEMQILLLRVLQDRAFERLGGASTLKANARIIAATNRNLLEDVRAGRFREDLFYRLNVFPIHVPPLRDRREDVPLLVSHFAEKYGQRHQRPIKRIERRTVRMLVSYSWPGNVRELENLIERAVILSRLGTLRLETPALPGGAEPASFREQMQGREREAIEYALRSTRGRVSGPKGAAVMLALPASTLESRIARLGIDKFRFRARTQGRSIIVMPASVSPPPR
jgi:formate hydrogenlyase transcriptional activator